MARRWRSAVRFPRPATSTTRASSFSRSPSTARRRTCPARATARARSCRPRRTWSCGMKRSAPTSTASASSRCRRWNCRSASSQPLMDEIQRVASEVLSRDKFLVSIGGEHSITPPLVAAAAARYRGVHVLQIDAHADLRDSYMGTRHNHACAMRRSLEHAPVTQVGIRSMSTDEAAGRPSLRTSIFYDCSMRAGSDVDRPGRRVARRSGLHHHRRRRDGSGDHAVHRHARTRRAVLVRDARASARDHRAGAMWSACDVVELSPLPGADGPELPLRQADLQDPHLRFARNFDHSS